LDTQLELNLLLLAQFFWFPPESMQSLAVA